MQNKELTFGFLNFIKELLSLGYLFIVLFLEIFTLLDCRRNSLVLLDVAYNFKVIRVTGAAQPFLKIYRVQRLKYYNSNIPNS